METARGKLRARCVVTDQIKPGVVCLEPLFYRQSINVLSSIEDRDPIFGSPNLRGMRCRPEPAAGSSRRCGMKLARDLSPGCRAFA